MQSDRQERIQNQNRIQWLDVLKCLTMLLVVVGHASKGDTPDTYRYYIYSFHMPLFFIISGMTFYLQCQKREFTFKTLAQNKAKGLVWPYFALSFLTIPFWFINYRVIGYRDQSLGNLIYGIFYSHQHHVLSPSNAMWFCVTLFLTLLVFWLINKWVDGSESKLILVVSVIALAGYWLSFVKVGIYLPWHIDTVTIALIFVLMGWLLIKYIKPFLSMIGNKHRQLIWLTCAFVIGFLCARYNVKISMALNHYGNFILLLGGVIGFGLVCIIISMNLPSLKFFKFMGRNTIVILAFHSPVYRLLERISTETAWMLDTHPIIMGIAVFIAMAPICYIFEKWLPWVLGRKKKM